MKHFRGGIVGVKLVKKSARRIFFFIVLKLQELFYLNGRNSQIKRRSRFDIFIVKDNVYSKIAQ